MTNLDNLLDAAQDTLDLFEAWKNDIFANIGIKWISEPPAIIRLREAISDFKPNDNPRDPSTSRM